MEEGTKTKKTVFVGGISDDTDETALYEGFSTFGAHIPISYTLMTMNHCRTLIDMEFLIYRRHLGGSNPSTGIPAPKPRTGRFVSFTFFPVS